MLFEIQRQGDIPVVALRARVDARIASQLRQEFEKLANCEDCSYIIDLGDVDFLDSAGLVPLVKLLKHARKRKGEVALIRSRKDAANRILKLTKFDQVFHMADSRQGALEHLKTLH
jgi:anti-sigma B factor antagonist